MNAIFSRLSPSDWIQMGIAALSVLGWIVAYCLSKKTQQVIFRRDAAKDAIGKLKIESEVFILRLSELENILAKIPELVLPSHSPKKKVELNKNQKNALEELYQWEQTLNNVFQAFYTYNALFPFLQNLFSDCNQEFQNLKNSLENLGVAQWTISSIPWLNPKANIETSVKGSHQYVSTLGTLKFF